MTAYGFNRALKEIEFFVVDAIEFFVAELKSSDEVRIYLIVPDDIEISSAEPHIEEPNTRKKR